MTTTLEQPMPAPSANGSAKPDQVAEMLLGDPLTLGYKPASPNMLFWARDGTTPDLFALYRDIEAMRVHPRVKSAFGIYCSGIAGAKFRIRASSSAVGAFVESELQRFWTRGRRTAQLSYEYGYGGFEPIYEDEAGALRFAGLIPFHPNDTSILTRGQKYVGIKIRHVDDDDGKREVGLWGPGRWPAKAFWHSHNRRYHRWYGITQYLGAWRPWRRLAARDGAEEIIDGAIYRFGYSGPTVYYPPKESPGKGTDGRSRMNRDVAREFAEGAKSGVSSAFPSTTDTNGKREWEVVWPQHTLDVSGLLEYEDSLEKKISLGLDVFPEIFEASEVGSGWSGRMVPLEAFYMSQQDNAESLVYSWKAQLGDPLVEWNYGPEAWFEVEVLPLLATKMQEAGANKAAQGGPPQPGQPQNAGQQQAGQGQQGYGQPYAPQQPATMAVASDADGRWITIGGKEGADGKKHGGSPVFIKGGRIVKGHPGLVGKKIGALDDGDREPKLSFPSDDKRPKTVHRKEAEAAINAERSKADKVYRGLKDYLSFHGAKHQETGTHYVGRVLGSNKHNPTPTNAHLHKSVEQAKEMLRGDVGRMVAKAKESGATVPHELLADYPELQEPKEPTHRQQLNQSKDYSRAVWAKKARAEGIDPKSLHQLAGEMLEHDKAFKADHTKILQEARRMSKKMGFGDISNLATHAGRGGLDVDKVKGIDTIAAALAESHPEHFAGHDPEQRLFDLLTAGNPEHMTEEEAYEHALEHLREAKGPAYREDRFGLTLAFDERLHPRGQPTNAGQFAAAVRAMTAAHPKPRAGEDAHAYIRSKLAEITHDTLTQPAQPLTPLPKPTDSAAKHRRLLDDARAHADTLSVHHAWLGGQYPTHGQAVAGSHLEAPAAMQAAHAELGRRMQAAQAHLELHQKANRERLVKENPFFVQAFAEADAIPLEGEGKILGAKVERAGDDEWVAKIGTKKVRGSLEQIVKRMTKEQLAGQAKAATNSLDDKELFKRSGEGFENLQKALGVKKPVMGEKGADNIRKALAAHPGGNVIAALLAVDGSETAYDRNGFADRGGDVYQAAIDGKFSKEELKAAADWLQSEFNPSKELNNVNQHRWIRGNVLAAKPKEETPERPKPPPGFLFSGGATE